MTHTSAGMLNELRGRAPRLLTLAPALIANCVFAIALMAGASRLAAQSPTPRLLHVTVNDPAGRFVTGLEREQFEVVDNGVHRAINNFSNVDSPIALAVVGDTPLALTGTFSGPGDELIQTRTVSDALRQLAASKTSRKVLVSTIDSGIPSMPADIEVIQTESRNLIKAIVELRNQYLIACDCSPSVEVVVKQPRGLPLLRPNWK